MGLGKSIIYLFYQHAVWELLGLRWQDIDLSTVCHYFQGGSNHIYLSFGKKY